MGRGLDLVFSILVLACAPACFYDADNRCGEHQVLEKELCVCEAGFVLEGNGCKPGAASLPDGGLGFDAGFGGFGR
jgi:hypothetical protein